jgi:sugar (pentulose or hexulose) kinase
MAIVLGTDLGTTTITTVAVDATTGDLVARSTEPNQAETTAPADKARGYSEWDVPRIADSACASLRAVVAQLGSLAREVVGLGITGQQHGVVLVDERLVPLSPLMNWQDQRGEQTFPGSDRTFVDMAIERLGTDAPRRAGCRLAAGYMAVTLFWLRVTQALPKAAIACFVMDYFGAWLTGSRPVTDATCAASSGVFNVADGDWDPLLLHAIGLPRSLFPKVCGSGDRLGGLAPGPAAELGLPAGLPAFVGVGDNQASFLGSVANQVEAVLVNVGTGGQVAAYVDQFQVHPLLETRPFPRGGYLLVCAGLCGGRAYALLERFYRDVGSQLLGSAPAESVYQAMNRLPAAVPRGAGGLRCEPFFTGTRTRPDLRGSWSGISAANFTPGHMTRALLEGMARAFHSGYEAIVEATGRPRSQLVGAGNGLRENPVLAQIVADEMQLPLALPAHREEAAYGAALLAAVGAGIQPDLLSAGRLIRYENSVAPVDA